MTRLKLEYIRIMYINLDRHNLWILEKIRYGMKKSPNVKIKKS